jgi:hypothetical protein
MANSEMTVEIKADTRQLDRSIRRVQSQLFWLRYGDAITTIAAIGLFAIGILVGVVAS